MRVSNTELKILQEIKDGKTSLEMTSDIGLTVGTINNYINILLQKTGTNNRAQLIYEAVKKGIL